MGVSALRGMVSSVLLVLFPFSLFAADSNAAMLYANGHAWVNGSHVPRSSSSILPGDLLQTRSDSIANINQPGSTVQVLSDSLVQFDGGSVKIDHGVVRVSTSRLMATTAGDVKVVPTSNAWTEFNVMDVDGTVRISARKGDVTVSDGKQTVLLAEGQDTTRDESSDTSSGKGTQKKRKGTGAAAPGATGGILNSPIAIGIGGAAVAGLTAWAIFHDDEPVSPAKPVVPVSELASIRHALALTHPVVPLSRSTRYMTRANSLSRTFIISLPDEEKGITLALDENIYELRREKLKKIQALGQPTYRTKYEFTHTLAQILADYSARTAEELEQSRVNVRVAGRIMALRLMGKAGFAHIQQDGKRLQIYVKKDAVGEKGFELYKLLDLGDYVGLSGYLFRTKTGELTVHVEQIEFLSKDLLPLPEKWHGLTDVELRYRQRYVDLVMNPDVREVFLKRTKLIQSVRRTLDNQGFIEVETPMMQPIAGGAVARPFVTHHNTLDMDLYLRIAPELYLKRLVVGGLDRVYEINRNFRNEGLGWRWNPEFTMMEAYQAYTDYQGIMNVTTEVITEAAKAVNGSTKSRWTVTEEGVETVHELDWANWQRLTMREAIIKFWPERAGSKPRLSDFATHEGVRQLVERFNVGHSHMPYDPNAPSGKTIADLFEATAEEHLVQPTIIYEFPTAVSPLSKQKPDEPEWTERWEIFAGQMEISNGFSELNDPEDQRRRFEAQLQERERGDEEAHQMDEDYIRALSYGMPPAGGVGLGIDRLTMLLTDQHTIRDVILFPLLRPEKPGDAKPTHGAEDATENK